MGENGRATVGWREWVLLPELTDEPVKAKVDTGARTSTLHAFDIVEVEREGEPWVRFRFHPRQRDERTEVRGQARLLEWRRVTSSSGESELRPVVATRVVIDGAPHAIELTLTRRDAMGFRMLLGRQLLREGFVVDPRRSYRTAESKQVRKRMRKERRDR